MIDRIKLVKTKKGFLKVWEVEPNYELAAEEIAAHLKRGMRELPGCNSAKRLAKICRLLLGKRYNPSKSDEELLESLEQLLDGLIADAFNQNNPKALNQLREIHKLVYPSRYELPAFVARGMQIRKLMSELSFVVEPCSPESESILQGPVRLREKSNQAFNQAYQLAKKHWKSGTTLQALAVRIYCEEMNPGVEMDIRGLKRALARLAKWADSDADQSPAAFEILLRTGETLPFQYIAPMSRKPGSGGSRKRKPKP